MNPVGRTLRRFPRQPVAPPWCRSTFTALSKAESRLSSNSSSVKTGSVKCGGMPVPSKVLPERVRNSSFGSQADMPPGSLRAMTSEKTPWVGCPIRTVLPGRSMRAWTKVSPR